MSQELQKYLFDRHNFDAGAVDPEHPPAPTFSEDELATAKAQAYADGHRKGLQDGQESRDKQLVMIADRMTADLKTLINGEAARAATFERETMRVILALYQRTFPLLNAQFGIPQITNTIEQTLKTLAETATIQIEVATEDLEELSDRLKPFMHQHQGQITLISGPDVEAGGFRIKWKDGGARRDPTALYDQLVAALTQTLADLPETTHT